MEQAQGLVRRAHLVPHWLTDARDLTGERLRLWDVFGSVDTARVTPALAEAFEQVSWLPGPLPAAVWVVDLARANAALPAEALTWRSAPVGVLYVGTSRDATRETRGHVVQAQMQAAFQGFQHAQYLGVLSSRSGFDLLHSLQDLFRKKDSQMRKQVHVFRKWCLEWRRKHWLGPDWDRRVSPRMGE